MKKTLSKLTKERKEIEDDVDRAQLERKQQELLEEHFWEVCNEFEVQLLEFKEEHGSVIERKRHIHSHLEKLRSTNVCNDTFHISRDGHFGTINNLRIGSLPSQPVRFSLYGC